MNDEVANDAGADIQTPRNVSIWRQHVREAAKKFLKTAVVIDDRPVTEAPIENTENADVYSEAVELTVPDNGITTHPLNIVQISDAFINEGITCAFVLPDTDGGDDLVKRQRALKAAKVADLVIIDWFLKRTDASLTLNILEDIAKEDSKEKGRLRLVCIYTGQVVNQQMLTDVKTEFMKSQIELVDIDNGNLSAKSENTLVIILNKYVVTPEQLPSILLDSFSELSQGLVPSFALAAIGAIRNNTHHMLTRFGAVLDSAYISNRLITNPPGDVAELMRELLVAECDNAIGLDRVADEFLENDTIKKWIEVNRDKIKPASYKTRKGEAVEITVELLEAMLKNGVSESDFKLNKRKSYSFPEEARNSVSVTLAGGRDISIIAENKFSRLVAFRRESYGSTTRLMNPKWLPSMTTGTVLKYLSNGVTKYLMCFTPACDTLRIEDRG